MIGMRRRRGPWGPLGTGGSFTGSGRGRRTTGVGLLLLTLVATLLLGASLPATAAPGAFVSLSTPARLLDTRVGKVTADGRYQGVGAVRSGTTYSLPVTGRVSVPSSGVAAVVLNVTSVNPTGPGYVTAFPCGGAVPRSSSLNLVVGAVTPNAVIARPGVGGAVCFWAVGTTDLVVDVSGYFVTGGVDALPSPVRLLDTRPATARGATVDGQQVGHGPLASGAELAVPVAGRGGLSTGARSVLLNLTVVSARSAGYLAVYPCGGTRPASSTLNFTLGTTRANAVVSGLSPDGKVCVYSVGVADVVLDASGSLPTTTFSPLAPARLLDTRARPTVDTRFSGVGPQPAGASVTLPVAGRGGVPAGAKAVVLNVTAVAPTLPGFTTVFPQGATPNASNLNYAPKQIVANLVVAPLSASGTTCLTTSGSATDLVVDVTGYLTSDVAAGSSPCPSLSVSTNPDTVRESLVYRAPLQRVVGTDRVAVVVCSVPAGYPGYDAAWTPVTGMPVDATTVATWANTEITPYYRNVSGGRYTPTFTAFPPVVLSTATALLGGPDDCLATATASVSTAGYTSVLATDNRAVPYGFAGPGNIPATSNPTVLTSGTPRVSGRGLYVGGDPVFVHPNPMIAIHEMGHTVHWPHSFLSSDEYDNPTDLMSGSPGAPGNGWCSTGDGFSYPCEPQGALAFDRMAAGWMSSRQSVVHSGVVNYDLDAANSSAADAGGTQLVAVRDPADPLSVLTLEGRAATGYDTRLTGAYCHVLSGACDPLYPAGHDGVVVSLVRQTPSVNGISLNRRESQAMGRPYSFDHVLRPGDSVTVDGVHIAFLARTGNVFTVQVYGSYVTPASIKTTPTAAKAPSLLTRATAPGAAAPVTGPTSDAILVSPPDSVRRVTTPGS